MTTIRRTARQLWPTTPRRYTRRDALHGFLLRLGLYGALGLAAWAHWWYAVRP